MNSNKLINLFKERNIVVPLYLYKSLGKLNIDLESFILLMYFYNDGEKSPFNPEKIINDLGIEVVKLMEYITKLTEAKLISLEVIKNDKGVLEEYINLDLFYEKLMLIVMDENIKSNEDTNIFEKIEREFGRTLSPIEYELVKAWLENNINITLIEEALKEATLNGVSNLRYMDKIIYEWGKKGFKNKEDVEKHRVEHNNNISKEKIEVFEYNWLDDDDE